MRKLIVVIETSTLKKEVKKGSKEQGEVAIDRDCYKSQDGADCKRTSHTSRS
jgi:hypothetical protein